MLCISTVPKHPSVHFLKTSQCQDIRTLHTAIALPEAEPLSWFTLRLATLLVLSNITLGGKLPAKGSSK